jgi:hypothetical protein
LREVSSQYILWQVGDSMERVLSATRILLAKCAGNAHDGKKSSAMVF